jgi:hypothetical protein
MIPRPITTGYPEQVLLDQKSVTIQTRPAAAGVCTATFAQVDAGRLWLVDRLVVNCSSTTPTKAYVYDDSTPSTPALLGGTNSGNFDYDDTQNPYLIAAGKTLTVQWTGASAAAVGVVRIQYRLLTAG